MLAAGDCHTLVLDVDNNLWAAGYNSDGQLQIVPQLQQNLFVKVCTLPFEIAKVFASPRDKTSIFLDVNGEVWFCGSGTSIYGSEYKRENVIKIVDIPTIVTVACAFSFSLLLDSTGCIWRFERDYKEILNKTAGKFTKFETSHIGYITNVKCGDYFSIVMNDQGDLWTSGYWDTGFNRNGIGNSFQKLPTEFEVQDFCCGQDFALVLDTSGKVWGMGSSLHGKFGRATTGEIMNEFCQIPNIPEIRSIFCGSAYIGVIDEEGLVYVCGQNYYGNLGKLNDDVAIPPSVYSPTVVLNIPKICKGLGSRGHTFLVDEEGKLWASGANEFGQLGLGEGLQYIPSFQKVDKIQVHRDNTNRFRHTKRADK